mgnify:CR=1 FL=1
MKSLFLSPSLTARASQLPTHENEFKALDRFRPLDGMVCREDENRCAISKPKPGNEN